MQKLIVTDAGLAALINAQHSGTTPIVITQLKLGDSKWIADASATELKNVTKTFDVQYGGTLDPHTIQVAAIDQSEEQYQAYELGIFTDSGILFAVVSSDSTPVIEKHGSSIIEILCHVVVKSAEDGDIQVGDGTLSFITPSASETTAGIAQFATEEEVLAGEEDSKMISPATLHKKTATEERIGLVELATVAEVKTGTDGTRAITPKSLMDAGIVAVPTATDAVQGKVELATTDEVKAGTDATRAVTPKGLKDALGTLVPDATEAVKGIVELATADEVKAGTDATRVVTPAGLKQFIDRGQLGGVKDLGTGVDLDTLTTTGRYWCLGTGMTNYPAANPIAAVVEVDRPGDNANSIHQTYIACTVTAQHETTVFVYYRHTYTDSGVIKWAKWSRGNIASETEIGQLALATAEEVTAGTIGTKAVTPKTLKAAIGSLVSGIPDATTSVKGKVQLATDTEAAAGTNSEKALTPANLKQFIDRGQIGSVTKQTGELDLNKYTEAGNYWVNATGQVNGPRTTETGGIAGVLNVYKNADVNNAWILQIFTEAGSTIDGERVADCWHRNSTTGGEIWSTWNTGNPASETIAGTVKLATSTEVSTGTEAKKAVTPAGLKQFLDRGQLGMVKSLGNGIDLNTLTENGRYWVNGTGQSNGPTGHPGIVEVYSTSEENKGMNVIQSFVASNGSDTNCYHRRRTNPSGDSELSWSEWNHGTYATTEKEGVIELATSDEVKAGTDSTRAVTTKALKDNYLPLTGGTVTGATTFTGALKSGSSGSLNLATKLVSGVSISGKVITFTFNDGTTQKITTQDTVTTNTSNWSISKGTNGWARDNSTGFTIQWGTIEGTQNGNEQEIGPFSYPRAFTVCYGLFPSLINDDSSWAYWDCSFQARKVGNTSFYLMQQLFGDGWFSWCFWLAVGIS